MSDAEQQRADDLAWLEREAKLSDWEARHYRKDRLTAEAEGCEADAARARRIIGYVHDPEPSDYLCELEDIICDTLRVLEEATGGTDPGLLRGTLAALRSIVSTMDARRTLSESDLT